MKGTLLFICLFWNISTFASPATTTEFIRIDQFGYRLGDQKVAVISNPVNGFNSSDSFSPGTMYEVRRWSDDVSVFSAAITAFDNGNTHVQSGDQVWLFDFSSVVIADDYYIYDVTNDVGSYQFTVSDDVYNDVLKQSVRAFYYQRCGVEKTVTHGGNWNDGICHHGTGQDLASRSVTDQNNAATERDLSGGWHDAGDYNKYVNFTYAPVHSLLFAYQKSPTVFGDDSNIPESGNGIADVLDEVKFELDWLLKMQDADGSVLMKISVPNFEGGSPPSSDATSRYYGEAASSATATAASIFAHAYMVFKDVPGMTTYANNLRTKAEEAWTWIQSNSSFSTYANTGFQSTNPEISTDEQKEVRVGVAVMLFAATGNTSYRDFVDNNYTDIRPIQWTFWYPFQPTIQEIALYYSEISGATSAVANSILTSFQSSTVSNNNEMLSAWLSNTDAYRAYLKDDNYVWGSNQVKARTATMFANMNYYNLSAANAQNFDNAALGYVHNLHGTNPLGKVMLTNMGSYGAEVSCDEIYHGWFDDGTIYDNAQTSTFGPAPGIVPGGPNPNYSPAMGNISPPQGQPIQKSYKDWNTTYPENSWEITENAIYYQAAYVQLLAAYSGASSIILPVEFQDFYAKLRDAKMVDLTWITSLVEHVDDIEIQRGNNPAKLETIGQTSEIKVGKNTFIDRNPAIGMNYYRLRINDLDGSIAYSKTISIRVAAPMNVNVFPNPATKELNVFIQGNQSLKSSQLTLLNMTGQVVFYKKLDTFSMNFTEVLDLENRPRGVYYLKIENGVENVIKKVVLK
ncbi:MAG: endoglucanase [Paraglaciecola sp.]|jgi:endoglucanase